LEKNEHAPLLLIPMFVLDFLCIHPFNDGNGRMIRLLTWLLFYRAGYIVGKYISMEKLIENSKDTYDEALRAGSGGLTRADRIKTVIDRKLGKITKSEILAAGVQ
jgi:Fic family protein